MNTPELEAIQKSQSKFSTIENPSISTLLPSQEESTNTFFNEKDNITNSNSTLNLQYSLSLIKVSIEYLANAENETMNEKTASEPIEEFITFFKDESSQYSYSKEMLKELLRDHERIIIQLRKNLEHYSKKFGYTGLTGSITRIIQEHQRITWQLRSCF